jgi:hypothetical protein
VVISRRDDPECRAGDHSRHPGELRMKLLDIRSLDRDVAADFVVRIKQRKVVVLWHALGLCLRLVAHG